MRHDFYLLWGGPHPFTKCILCANKLMLLYFTLVILFSYLYNFHPIKKNSLHVKNMKKNTKKPLPISIFTI